MARKQREMGLRRRNVSEIEETSRKYLLDDNSPIVWELSVFVLLYTFRWDTECLDNLFFLVSDNLVLFEHYY